MEESTCSSCSRVIGNADTPCPRCMMEFAFEDPPPSREADPLVGTTLGDYRILDVLGQGGMGVVYRARQEGLQREVALKVLASGSGASSTEIERLHLEARAAARLQHPNIVPVHEVSQEEDLYFFTMDYVEGPTLAEELTEHPPDPRRAVTIIAQVVRAVQYAHEAEIIHRDLKPANILMNRRGEPLLTDFGLARELSGDIRVTASGVLLGTPAYMSPEQARGHSVGKSSDIYNLGVILYEMLTGELPFPGNSPMEVLQKILEREPPPPGKSTPDLDRDLDVIVLKCLEKQAERRYPSAEALADDLERWLAGEPIRARAPSVHYRLRKYVSKRKGILIPTFIAVTLGLVLGGWWWKSEQSRAVGYGNLVEETEKAFELKEWAKALHGADQALALQSNGRMEEISRKSRDRIALIDLLSPYPAMIEGARHSFYIKHVNLQEKLLPLQNSLEKLDEIMNDPPNRDYAYGWELLGTGWYFMGANNRAYHALQRAEKLEPDRGAVLFFLGKVLLMNEIQKRTKISDGGVRETIVEGEPVFEVLLRRSPREEQTGSVPSSGIRKAWDYLERAGKGWRGGSDLELHLATVYFALAQGRKEDVLNLCREGLKRFGGRQLGVEEYWNLQGYLAGDPKESIRAYTKAIEIRPHYGWGFLMRGFAYAQEGDYERAGEDFSAIIKAYPSDSLAFYNRGITFVLRGKSEQAIEDFTRAVLLGMNNMQVYLSRGQSRYRAGDSEGAIEDCTEAIRLFPDRPEPYGHRGSIYSRIGQWPKALVDFNEALKRDPGYFNAWVNRGGVYKSMKKLDRAISDFKKASEIRPEDPVPLINQAICFISKKDLSAAVTACKKAIKLDPKNGRVWKVLGDAYIEVKRWKEAISFYTRALDLDPALKDGWHNRGLSRWKSGDPDGALDDLSRAIRMDPDYEKALFTRADVFRSRGDLEGALADYTRVISLDGKEKPQAWINRGHLRRAKKDYAGAVADYSALIDLGWGERYRKLILWRGHANYGRKKFDLALADYEIFIRDSPEDPAGYSSRGLLLLLKDRENGAAAVGDFERALELAPPDWADRRKIESLLRKLRETP